MIFVPGSFVQLGYFLAGYGFDRNVVAIVKHERPPDDMSTSEEITKDVHGVIAHIAMWAMVFQFVSGLWLVWSSNKKESVNRKLHRWNGWPTASLWITAILSGYFFFFTSEKFESRREELGVALYHTIASLVNLYNGLAAVAGRRKEGRDYFKHKGSMFFAFTWFAVFGAGTTVTILVQYCLHGCALGTNFKTLWKCIAMYSIVAGLVWYRHRLAGGHFNRPFINYNIYAMGVLSLFYTVLLVFSIMSPNEENNPNACFGRL
eukprot:scaffold45451_cov183-Amphora_coffeaeformis.AAC.2